MLQQQLLQLVAEDPFAGRFRSRVALSIVASVWWLKIMIRWSLPPARSRAPSERTRTFEFVLSSDVSQFSCVSSSEPSGLPLMFTVSSTMQRTVVLTVIHRVPGGDREVQRSTGRWAHANRSHRPDQRLSDMGGEHLLRAVAGAKMGSPALVVGQTSISRRQESRLLVDQRPRPRFPQTALDVGVGCLVARGACPEQGASLMHAAPRGIRAITPVTVLCAVVFLFLAMCRPRTLN
jgi:hypothetical protein